MFDLERSIAEWRKQMLAAGIRTPVPLVELESHLRDEVDEQMRAGASAEVAFSTAIQRIGKPKMLKEEFDKSATIFLMLHRRYLWLFCVLTAPLLVVINVWAVQPGETSSVERFLGLASITVLALYIGCLPFFDHRLPSVEKPLMRAMMLMGSVFALLWPIVATLISVEAVPLKLGIVVELLIWGAGVAWFATWLAYAVSGWPLVQAAVGSERS